MNANSIPLTPVQSSKIAAIGHDVASQTLAVQFFAKGAPGNVYHYANFTAGEYAAFASAESVGKHFLAHVQPRKDKHPYVNMGVPSEAPVGVAVIGEYAEIGAPAVALIGPAPVTRDAEGWWSHPGIPDFDEGQEAEYAAWILAQGLKTTYASLESENDTHPAYVEYFERSGTNVSAWEPAEPAGEGWFTISIHDSEDGPYWVWARRVDVAADHALALTINAECYGEPLPGGQRYSRTTFKDTGYPILLTADGKRSVFCDLCDDMEDAA